jgi:hypothetical protein
MRLALNVQTLDDLTGVAISSMVTELITIPAALISIQIIKKVSSFEEELWEEALNPSDSVFAIATADVPPAAPAS